MQPHPKLIAIVGGSGAGKTWLARSLRDELSPAASHLSLDDFYHDRTAVQPRMRERLNYDHPRAVDWRWLEIVLRDCRAGKFTQVPHYDFSTHTRVGEAETFLPGCVVLVEGLWLLVRPRIRALFDFSIYLECPVQVRLERRLTRDAAERGRDSNAARELFWKTVVPMHERFVAPQAAVADIIISEPPGRVEIENLAETIRALVHEDDGQTLEATPETWPELATTTKTSRAAAVRPAEERLCKHAYSTSRKS